MKRRALLLLGPLLLGQARAQGSVAVDSAFVAKAELPDSPGALAKGALAQTASVPTPSRSVAPAPGSSSQNPVLPPCPTARPPRPVTEFEAAKRAQHPPCTPLVTFQPIVDTGTTQPLSVRQKGILALRDIADPFNLLTVLGTSAITIGSNAHTAYGPGMRGYLRNAGTSFSQEATGEFIGTFLACSLVHQDPRYHRMPEAPVPRRFIHAVLRTWVAQHDDGRRMPNYENFISYPVTAEIANLYVPGLATDAPSTGARILTGLATDPIGNLIAEFLPDLARRVHIRVVFVQQIMNRIATGDPRTDGN